MPIELFSKIQPFAIALALGLLIGVERERSHPVGYQPLGLRTFILFSLLGAIAANLNQPYIGLAITLFVGAVVIAGYLRSSRASTKNPDIGFTTEVAAVVTYGLGFYATSEPFIALIVGVVALVVLMARTRLHTFSRTQLRPEEMQATAIILVLAIGIIPFLPNKALDPWSLVNLRRFGILVLIIALLRFAAYIGIRLFGAAKGILLSGFLAGFVSSTAATASITQQVKRGEAPPLPAALAVVFSTIAMFLKLIFIIFIVSPDLLYSLCLPLFIVVILSGGAGLLISRNVKITDQLPAPKNPLALWSAIKLALFLAALLIAVTLAQRFLGAFYAQLVIFLGGLVEMQGIGLALSILYHNGQINLHYAINSMGIAILASFFSKYVIAWSLIRNKYSVWLSLALGSMVVIYCLTWALVILLYK